MKLIPEISLKAEKNREYPLSFSCLPKSPLSNQPEDTALGTHSDSQQEAVLLCLVKIKIKRLRRAGVTTTLGWRDKGSRCIYYLLLPSFSLFLSLCFLLSLTPKDWENELSDTYLKKEVVLFDVSWLWWGLQFKWGWWEVCDLNTYNIIAILRFEAFSSYKK